MNTRYKKKDKKLAGVRQAVAEKEVEVAVAKKQAVQHANHADQIEAIACSWQEEVAWLTGDIDSLRELLESARDWREESNRQAQEIKDLQQKEMLALQQKMDASEIKCLKNTKKVEVCHCVLCLDYIWIGFSNNIIVEKVYPFSSSAPNYQGDPPNSWRSTVEWVGNQYGYWVVDPPHTFGIHHV